MKINIGLTIVLVVLMLPVLAQKVENKTKVPATVAGTLAAAPDFTKKDILGNAVSLSQFKGKYVLIDFWGSWCGACRMANPHLKELYAKYAKKGFEIVGISAEKSKDLAQAQELWKKAVKEDDVPWVNLLNNEADMKQDVPKMYAIYGYPTHILLDKEGKVLGRWTGWSGTEIDDRLKAIFN